MADGKPNLPGHFINGIIDKDIESNKNDGRVHTRFPPEPNGYLHIGHAKAICLNFGLAQQYQGHCNLRFDDTNPSKEDVEYVDSIQEDVRWLGFDWGERKFFASDYFDKLYQYAVTLIKNGDAYICELNAEETREYRGSLTEPGKNSPHRDRSIEENLTLFGKMKAGELEEGFCTLRAKINMASPNLNMRDPVIYRIQKSHHHRTGDAWCIYPMYDYAHGLSDSIEGITHSICTLEFENHRPLYDWFIEKVGVHHPKQIEFARLNLTRTVMSKRKLRQLVEEKLVTGWDDPRMPTISGMRRRGYSAEALREFCAQIGVTKFNATIEMSLLDSVLRKTLNKSALRTMAVLDPVKLIIDNYPDDQVEMMNAVNNPEDPEAGKREVALSKELWIERADFEEIPPKKWRRMTPGSAVRLRYGYIIDCTGCVKDESGKITEIHCTYDVDTRSGTGTSERKVKGAIHWVSVKHAETAEVRLYDFLLREESECENPDDFLACLNAKSLESKIAYVEPALKEAALGTVFQFERTAYFCVDLDSKPEKLVFNRTVTLRDSFSKKKGSQKGQGKGQKKGQKGKQGQQGQKKP
jgi:glutaminyl-tRNA synthetase